MLKIAKQFSIGLRNVRYLSSSSGVFTANKKRRFLYAVLTGTGIGTGYTIYQQKSIVVPDLSDLTFSKSIAARQFSSYAHHVDNSEGVTDKRQSALGRITLYQFFSCPFCCKVRTYLDYHGIDYDVVEVNSISKKQLKWSEYKKVPILVMEDHSIQLNDSSVIISILESKLRNQDMPIESILPVYGPSVSKSKGKVVFQYTDVYNMPGSIVDSEERRLREWVDKDLIPVAGLSIYDSLPEAIRSFQWFAEAGKWKESFGVISNLLTIYSGACVMYLVSKLRKRRVEQKTFEDVILALRHELTKASSEPDKQQFLGGKKPNLGDLSAYGALVALSGCDKFSKIREDQVVFDWWNRMTEQIQNHNGAQSHGSGQNLDISSYLSKWSNLKSSMLPVLGIFLIVKLVSVQMMNDHVF